MGTTLISDFDHIASALYEDTATDRHVVEFVEVSKAFNGKSALDPLSFTVQSGDFVTLLGPSGCGKTTVLRLIGGFERPDKGRILLDGVDVTDVPPENRAVNTVFQSYALFPHLTVWDNVAFGLRMKKMKPEQVRREVSEVLQLVNLSGLEKRRPAELSGGQQQRVAIARAIVNKPLILLLDEPLSALDYGLRKRMQTELKALQRRTGITFIFVTHDQEEAFAMSDKVMVMREGNIEQIGSPREIYEEPANMFTARFVGEINVFKGIVTERRGSELKVAVEGEQCFVQADESHEPGSSINILLRPEDFQIAHLNHLEHTPELKQKFKENGYFEGCIVDTIYKGATYDLTIRLKKGKTILATHFFNEDSEDVSFSKGDAVAVHWYPGWEVVFDHES